MADATTTTFEHPEQDVSFIGSDLHNLHTCATLAADQVWDWVKTNPDIKETTEYFFDALVFALGEMNVRIDRLVAIGEQMEVEASARRRTKREPTLNG